MLRIVFLNKNTDKNLKNNKFILIGLERARLEMIGLEVIRFEMIW